MKINFENYDLTNFKTRLENDHLLITPATSDNSIWTKDNLIFRSSIWNLESGELVSAGFPKFFYFGERKDIVKLPKELWFEKTVKIDGSCLIISTGDSLDPDKVWCRTRGTFDVKEQPNGYEAEDFKKLFLHSLKNAKSTFNWKNKSFLFEWYSPRNKIIIDYGHFPRFYMIGIIDHKDYKLHDQISVDYCAHNTLIPRLNWTNESYDDAVQLINSIYFTERNTEPDCEGFVFYSGQTMFKVKTKWYNERAYLKHHLSEKRIFEMFVDFIESSPNFKFSSHFYANYKEFVETNVFDDLLNRLNSIQDKFMGIVAFVVKTLKTVKNPDYFIIEKLFGDDMIKKTIAYSIINKKPLKRVFLRKLLKSLKYDNN